jgi:hypothetical protein
MERDIGMQYLIFKIFIVISKLKYLLFKLVIVI